MNSDFLIAILSGTGAFLGWGIADFFAKKTVSKIGDLKTLFWAQTFGILPIFIYFLFNFSIPQISLSKILILSFYTVTHALAYLMYYRAFEKGQVSIISPISASYAAFAVLASAFIFKEALNPVVLIGIVIVLLGIFLTSIDIKGLKDGSLDKKDTAKGLPQVLLAVLIFSFWYPFWDNFVSGQNWLFWVLALRIGISLTALLFSGSPSKVKFKDRSLFKWLLLVGLFDVSAYLSLTWGYSATKYTSVVSVLSAAYSLPTLILARVFLKEKLQKVQWLGALSIIGGLIYLAFIGS